MGVAGANAGNRAIVLAGLAGLLAGLLAGSLSMALGEGLSVQNACELYGRQIRIEAEGLAAVPEERIMRNGRAS